MITRFLAKQNRSGWLVSIPVRTLGAVLVMLAGFGIAVSIYVQAFAEDIYSARKQGLENIVSLAKNSIEPVLAETSSKKLTTGEARLKATDVINQFVYYNQGVANYVFLTTYEGYILVEPPFPEAVGTYQMQRRDAYGTPVTRLLLDKARAGGGFVEYYEAKLPGGQPQKKLSYVIGLPEIECYLGTGIYVNDIDQSIQQLKEKLLVLGFLIIAGVLVLQYYFLRPLLRCLYWLSAVFKHLGDNPAALQSFQLPTRFKNLDTEQLLASLRNMLVNFNRYRQTIEQDAEKFRQLAYATQDVIWEWDSNSRATVWSGDIKKLLGYEPAGLGAHFDAFDSWVHPEDRKKRRNALAAYFSGNAAVYTCEYRLRNAVQEAYQWVLVSGIATFGENRSPLSMIGAIAALPAARPEQEREPSQEQAGFTLTGFEQIGDIIQRTPHFKGDVLVVDVKKRLDSEQWQGIVVVENDEPVGLVMRDFMNYQLSSQYGVSLYYGRPIKLIMDEQPLSVEAGCSLEQVAEAARNRPEANLYDLIIVTERGKYLGTVSVMELLSRITNLRIMLAANANPLTGLPGNLVIEEKLKQALQHEFAALYIDLDNFKAFNDKYGFEMGDRVLKLTAVIIKEVTAAYKQEDIFLGHIGGDDFLILVYQPAAATAIAERIIREFDARIPGLYSPEDLARGYIVVPDRRGDKQQFQIMSISIAITENCGHRFTNHLEVGEVAAQLKKRAKLIDGSAWVIDQRKT